MKLQKRKWQARARRHRRVRRKVVGTPDRPRLTVFRSLKNVYCQVIDDVAGRTVASASSACPEIAADAPYGGNVRAAALVGALIAGRARAQGVRRVRFDRGPYQYHGRIKALAEAAREGGLEF